MKKGWIALLALGLLLCLCACGDYVSIMPGTELDTPEAATAENSGDVAAGESFEERPLLEFMSRENFAESYYDDTPVALSYQPTAEDGTVSCRAYIFDRAAIIAVCDALRSMTVTGRAAEEPVTYAEYILTRSGGEEIPFTFGLLADGTRVICAYTGDYTVAGGEAIWATEFPAYSESYDIFDLYFSADMRAFADDFAAHTPVSVGYRMNSGATITSTDPAAIEAVFRVLDDASVIVVENAPDQNIDLNQLRDYIFTMEDGTTYTFSFAEHCLAVTADPSFGPVYYWITGAADLWDIEIASENENGKFEGGVVADLREDTRRAAEVADGTSESDLTVLGVFVEYTIGEESSYIALDGDAAAEFVSRVCAVKATGETAEDVSGDKITVSVTLSDSSGPIFYFTGDTIQQVVGINYVCDSADMQALRDTILDLASTGENTAEIEEGGTD